MGTTEQFSLTDGFAGGGSRTVAVHARRDQLAALEAAAANARLRLRLHPVEPGRPIAAEYGEEDAVAVVEVDAADRNSLDRLVAFVRSRPSRLVIAAIAAPDHATVRTLMREGVSDVVRLPFDIDELTDVVLEASARRAQVIANVALAPVVAVVRSNGGCGASTIATNLAAALAHHDHGGREVVLADLDIQAGADAALLGAPATGSIMDLVKTVDRLDGELIRSTLVQRAPNFSLLPAPDEVTPLDRIETGALFTVLAQLRAHAGLLVVELPANLTDWSLSLINAAALVLVVTEASLPSLRQARRVVDLFDNVGIPRERVQLVVNRAEKKLFRTLRTEDVGETLHRTVAATVAADERTLSQAQDRALLAADIDRKSRFVKDVAGLAAVVDSFVAKAAE